MGDTPQKPPFDPTAQYEAVEDTATSKPPFDPTAQYDVVDEPPVSKTRPPLMSHAKTSPLSTFPGYGVQMPDVTKEQNTLQETMKSPAFQEAAEKAIPIYHRFQPKTGAFQIAPTAEKIMQDAQTNEPLLRHLLERTKRINPKLSGEVDAALYKLDARNRHGVSDLQEQNIKGLKSRALNYNVETGQLQKPLGFFQSIVTGIENNHKTIQEADDLMNTDPSLTIAKIEHERQSYNPDIPQEAPSGAGGMIGANAQAMLKGILGGTVTAAVASDPLTAAAAPWVGALVASPDFYKVALKTSFDNNYNEIRDKNPEIAPTEVYKEAMKRAQFDANLALAQGAALTGVGLKIKGAPPITKNLSGTAKQLFGQILENSAGSAIHALPELAATTGTAGAFQAIGNWYSGKPIKQNVGDAMLGNLALLGGITAISAGSHLLNTKPYKALINEFAKAPDHVVNETLAQAVLHGNLTPEQANDGFQKIADQKEIIKGMPDDVPVENVQKIRNRLDKIDEIKQTMSPDNPEALHPSFHAAEKEKVKTIEAEIEELKKPVKEENPEPLFKEPVKTEENAIPIRSTEKVPVDETSGNRPEVGARISGPEEPTGTQEGETVSQKTSSKGIMKKASSLDVSGPRDQVLQHFTLGGKIHADVVGEMYKKETTDFREHKASPEEMKARIGLLSKKGARSLDELAHNLWEKHGGIDNPHDTQAYKNAIMDVLGEHHSAGSMARELVDTYIDNLQNHPDISSQGEHPGISDWEIEQWKGMGNKEKEAALSMDDKTAEKINSTAELTPENIDEFNHLLNEDAYANKFNHPEEEATAQGQSIPEAEKGGAASEGEDKTATERAGKIKEAAVESMRVEPVKEVGELAAKKLGEAGKKVVAEHIRVHKNLKQLEQLIKCLW